MEKLRPLDAKLKYQIDKLLKIAATASNAIDQHRNASNNSMNNHNNVIQDDEDGLNFRPDMSNLSGPSGLNNEDGDYDSSNNTYNNSGDSRNSNVYQPPKRMAVQYFDDESAQAKAQRFEFRFGTAACTRSALVHLLL